MPKDTHAAAKADPPKQRERPKPVGDAEKLGLLLGWKCTKCGNVLEGVGNSVIRPCPKCGSGEFVRVGVVLELLKSEPAPLGASATNASTVVEASRSDEDEDEDE